MKHLTGPQGALMPRSKKVLFLLTVAAFFIPATFDPTTASSSQDKGSLSQDHKILHTLTRLGFGPRPGDMQSVRDMGLTAYIESQLHPEDIADKECDLILAGYPTLAMSSQELYKAFPPAKLTTKNPDGKRSNQKIKKILQELAEAKLARAVKSERQLNEVMVDLWYNHFNVTFQKNLCKWLVTSYERDTIRPHALGRFRDLLGAVAHSPAMMAYLDNAQSSVDTRFVPEDLVMENKAMAAMMDKAKANNKKMGLNENYARELMELHTLGVDGGYTQDDVINAARVLTGWSLVGAKPAKMSGKVPMMSGNRRGSGKVKVMQQPFTFIFRPTMHDPGDKTVLGKKFGPNDGMREGEELLDMLARHPHTAAFIATKLCRRFVSDDPPAALVKRVAQRFLATDGDIKETLRALFGSPEFFDQANFRSKVKSPFEFMVSALRATDAEVDQPARLVQVLAQMGEPPFLCEPPTGYSDNSSAWVSSGALLDRTNFSMALFSHSDKSPAHAQIEQTQGSDQELVESLYAFLLHGTVSDSTKHILANKLKDPGTDDTSRSGDSRAVRLAALVMSSPDFQRR